MIDKISETYAFRRSVESITLERKLAARVKRLESARATLLTAQGKAVDALAEARNSRTQREETRRALRAAATSQRTSSR